MQKNEVHEKNTHETNARRYSFENIIKKASREAQTEFNEDNFTTKCMLE